MNSRRYNSRMAVTSNPARTFRLTLDRGCDCNHGDERDNAHTLLLTATCFERSRFEWIR